MEKAENRYITVAYKLHSIENGETEFVEEAKTDHPFMFISGLGTTLEDFESNVVNLQKGEKFDFVIPVDKAYGEYNEEHVLDLPKNIFEINGKFDSVHIVAGNVVPLMDSEGHHMNGVVVEVKSDIVVVDMNHPLAGADLHFEGEVVENRIATPKEIQDLVTAMTGGGCGGCGGGDCGGCGGDCGDGGCGGCH